MLAAAAATIAFWNSLHYGFAQDAFTWLARSRGLIPHTTGWWRTISYDVYFRVMDALFGLDPLPYRVVGLLLHAANAVLLTLLGLRLGLSRAATFAAAMFFAAHNAHFDTLFAIASISELLAATFVLLALWIALSPAGPSAGPAREIGVTLAFAAALLSKETVILFPAVLWLVGRLRPDAARRAVIPCAILAVIYLVVFWITDPVGSLHAPRGANVYEPHWGWGLLAAWATYQAWSVHLFNFQASDLHDRIALHPEGWIVTAAAIVTLELLISRSRRAHRIESPLPAAAIGAATYTAFIAPVAAAHPLVPSLPLSSAHRIRMDARGRVGRVGAAPSAMDRLAARRWHGLAGGADRPCDGRGADARDAGPVHGLGAPSRDGRARDQRPPRRDRPVA
jgi:hypothetical protein